MSGECEECGHHSMECLCDEGKLPLTKKQRLLEVLDEMIKSYENLPQSAKIQPLVHYDLESVLLLMRELFKAS
jgi:hypothetical protein